MRTIDADAMMNRLKECDTEDEIDKALYNFTLNRINEQPTIQPVVRCKDCKHHSEEKPGMVYCQEIIDGWVKNDFFCAIWEGGEQNGSVD